jgi:uncharacterized protein involved in exopolysaccharide biosynthesis
MKHLPSESTTQLARRDLDFEFADSAVLLPAPREVIARIFRKRTVFSLTFLLVAAGFFLTGQFQPKYRSEMKLLVRKARVDPIMTTDRDSTPQLQTMTVREEDINSAVQLLRGAGLIHDAAVKSGLIRAGDDSNPTAKILRRLERSLDISAIPKTDLIAINYESRNPKQSRDVVSNLAELYLRKQHDFQSHASQTAFFDAQAQEHLQKLNEAQADLLKFTERTGVVSATLERDLTIHRSEDLETAKAENKASIVDLRGRFNKIEAQLKTTPPRIPTDNREADNPALLNQLNGTIASLMQKRTDLLNKYSPDYRLVKDVDREIATAQASLDAQQQAPMHDNTTSVNPTYLALKAEEARVSTELNGLQEKDKQLARSSVMVTNSAKNLAGEDIEQDALLRRVASEKGQYDLYLGKYEQARATDALDQKDILNVIVAEQPGIPVLPVSSIPTMIGACIFCGLILGFGAAMLADIFDPTVRNTEELIEVLQVPTLAEFGPLPQLERSIL